MSKQKLKNQIIDWLQGQQYWLQFLGNSLLESSEVDDDLISTTYEFYKEDEGLRPQTETRPAIGFNKKVTEDDAPDHTLVLQTIKNINNVNALAPGQVIKIGPNLTVIYGNNGSGKSGYVRLLNNAFPSRGDKEILPNVFAAANGGNPECQFTFKRTEDPYDLAYPDDGNKYEFAQFAVFDTKSVREHLDGENPLSFTPSGFDFFEKLMTAHVAIKEKLNAEIAVKSAMHDLAGTFGNENGVRTFIEGLGEGTKAEEIDALCSISGDAATRFDETKARLEQLKATDKTKQVEALSRTREQLNELCHQVQRAFAHLQGEKLSEYGAAIDEVKAFEDLAKAEGLQSLEKYNIAESGSPAWRGFVRAGLEYASAIENSRNGQEYPSDKDSCLFCLQPLGDEQNALIHAYWDLLRSNAEAELAKANGVRAAIGRDLTTLPTLAFDESVTVFDIVNKFNPRLAERWKGIIQLYNETRAAALGAINELDTTKLPPPIDAVVTEFDECGAKLDADKAVLIASNPQEEIEQLQKDIDLHHDRVLLGKIRPKLEAYIEAARWTVNARRKLPGLNGTSITRKQGSLYAEHVTEEYVAVFNEECRLLRAPSFVHLSQRNTRGNTLRKLKIADHGAMKILSEGEQRGISIADFVTEARLNPHNRGLIFDDPVSSQDHERRERIADRLVELAKFRQVIVFTHDIAFFLRLLAIAEGQQVPVEQNYIRKMGDSPGLVQSDSPWIAKPVKARIGMLKERLVELKKIEMAGDPDEYLLAAKQWYVLLRETWERAVEERLLKGVVERFAPGIQTQKLKKLEITEEMLSDIEKGMANCSQWVHDAAAGLNPTPPDTVQAQKDLDDIDALIAKCKAP